MEDKRPIGGAEYFPDDMAAAERFDALVDELGGTDTVTPQQVILISAPYLRR